MRSLGSQGRGGLGARLGGQPRTSCCCPLPSGCRSQVSWDRCGGRGDEKEFLGGRVCSFYLFLHSFVTSVCPKNILPFCLFVNSVPGVLLYTVSCVAFYASNLFLCCGRWLRCLTELPCKPLFPRCWTLGSFPVPPTSHSVPPPPPGLLGCLLHTSEPPPSCAPRALLADPPHTVPRPASSHSATAFQSLPPALPGTADSTDGVVVY